MDIAGSEAAAKRKFGVETRDADGEDLPSNPLDFPKESGASRGRARAIRACVARTPRARAV